MDPKEKTNQRASDYGRNQEQSSLGRNVQMNWQVHMFYDIKALDIRDEK